MPYCIRCGKQGYHYKEPGWTLIAIRVIKPEEDCFWIKGNYEHHNEATKQYLSVYTDKENKCTKFAGLCPDCQLPEKEPKFRTYFQCDPNPWMLEERITKLEDWKKKVQEED